MAKRHKLTGVQTHVATRVGHAEGRLVLPGEFVPAGIAVADHDGEEEVTHRDGRSETVPISGGWMTSVAGARELEEEGSLIPLAAPVRNLSPNEHQHAREADAGPEFPEGQDGPIATAAKAAHKSAAKKH